MPVVRIVVVFGLVCGTALLAQGLGGG